MKPMEELVRKNVQAMVPYATARDEFAGTAEVYLDANESPFNTGLNRYPDPYQRELRRVWAEMRGVQPNQVMAGNGSDELIDLLIRAFCEPGSDRIIICSPTYGVYKVFADINNVGVLDVPLTGDFEPDVELLGGTEGKLLFLCSPNNPTGNRVKLETISALCNSFDGLIVVDEAYIDFSNAPSAALLLEQQENLVVLQTMSKAWGMATIRMGFALAGSAIIQVLDRIKPPYNVNGWTQRVAQQAVEQSEQKEAWVTAVVSQREVLTEALADLSIVEKVFPSDANFILARFTDSRGVFEFLLEKGIVLRDRSSLPGCENCLRITVGTMEENVKLLKALNEFEL